MLTTGPNRPIRPTARTPLCNAVIADHASPARAETGRAGCRCPCPARRPMLPRARTERAQQFTTPHTSVRVLPARVACGRGAAAAVRGARWRSTARHTGRRRCRPAHTDRLCGVGPGQVAGAQGVGACRAFGCGASPDCPMARPSPPWHDAGHGREGVLRVLRRWRRRVPQVVLIAVALLVLPPAGAAWAGYNVANCQDPTAKAGGLRLQDRAAIGRLTAARRPDM